MPSAAAFGGYMATAFALVMCASNRLALAPPAAMGFEISSQRPEWSFWLALIVQGCGVGVCLICLANAPRLAPAAEVGIVMLLQLLLSPLWVWLAFGEVPAFWTIVGGLIIVATLAGHELAMQRLSRGDVAEAGAGAGEPYYNSTPVMSDAAPAAEQKKEAVRAQSCAL